MKVSVVIPTYCRSALVCEAIDSVLAQDGPDIEVVVIDDGSPDDTPERLRAYGDSIVVERQENQGLSAARNRGIEIASGEYIALLDDDDFWMPGKAALQCAILDGNPQLAATFSNFTIYRDDNDTTPNGMYTWFSSPPDWTGIFSASATLAETLGDRDWPAPDTRLYTGSLYDASLDQYFVLPSTSMIRREFLPDGTWFPLNDPICGDWDFFARLSKQHPVCFVDADTTFNRSHRDEFRLTQTRMLRQFKLRIDFLKRVYVADETYYANNREKVDRVWTDRLAQLCKLQLLDGDRQNARASATELRKVGAPISLSQQALVLLAAIPGSAHLARLARSIKRLA